MEFSNKSGSRFDDATLYMEDWSTKDGNESGWSASIISLYQLVALDSQGVICSGLAYYLQGVIMQYKGPVFVTTFSPLGMIICTIAGCMFLGEKVRIGGLIGATIIICGLYSVIWGRHGDKSSPISGNDQPEVSLHTVNGNIGSVNVSNHGSTRVVPTADHCDAV